MTMELFDRNSMNVGGASAVITFEVGQIPKGYKPSYEALNRAEFTVIDGKRRIMSLMKKATDIELLPPHVQMEVTDLQVSVAAAEEFLAPHL